MKHPLKILVAIVALLGMSTNRADAQRVAISTNALEWLFLSPNITGEVTISHTQSIVMDLSIDAGIRVSDEFCFSNLSLAYEYRHWLKQALYGHYVGGNIICSTYDIKLSKRESVGNIIAIGATYGYALVFNSRWNIVPNVGVGIGLNQKAGNDTRDIRPMLTALGLSIQYVIK